MRNVTVSGREEVMRPDSDRIYVQVCSLVSCHAITTHQPPLTGDTELMCAENAVLSMFLQAAGPQVGHK